MNRNDAHEIMGGMFGLPESVEAISSNTPEDLLFLNKSNLFLANARSGIFILVDLLKSTRVWMPSYLCPTMVKAVDQKKSELKFYEVDYDLQIPSLNWIKQIQTGDLIILIDYFGFPLSSKIVDMVKKQGGYVLEDASQALLSKHVGRHSDFVLFSPRKFIGVPDGGILVSCCDVDFDTVKLQSAPITWWMKMVEAAVNRREFDQYGGERRWYRLFGESSATAPCGFFSMSDLSKSLLLGCFDYLQIARQRVENYSILLHELKDLSLFDGLPKGTVPLGFPVRYSQRDSMREKLFQKHIYPPVHWALKGTVPEDFHESHRLADDMVTLLCDQRYSSVDVKSMASIIVKMLN